MIELQILLVTAAAVFCIGLYGVMSRRNAVLVLMSVELMLNAVNINLVAFSRYVYSSNVVGEVLVVFIITVAAAEVGLAMAIVLRLFRNWRTINLDTVSKMKN
jgi:NADH:ubiquinone oxidoreductase subunit K|tara:strand:+ start:3143 stop:3451 length:309 start_codon:yes stop_codon:yes gene_type:complete